MSTSVLAFDKYSPYGVTLGAGSVEAYVDFTKIGDGAIVQSADGKSVEIKLPAPQLGETNLDMEKSYVKSAAFTNQWLKEKSLAGT